ncbi:MAG: type I-F CRISPR-associated protein Csy2 [Candidatus Cloacimonadota bacterium]|nr:type I-F CRISPR-associated protein Csy2 [Candidatus Cloacimonadota bacterium]
MKRILLIPHVKVQNANALSSPYTIGFPAMTAWLGAVHALQRKLNQNDFKDVLFISTAVICHEIDLQTYKGTGDFVHSIVGTGTPLDKNGNRSAFIEEGRCHLKVSLVIEYQGVDKSDEKEFIEAISIQLHSGMKMASGDILDFDLPEVFKIIEEKDLRRLTRKLMPGYAIIERRKLMENLMKEGKDAIDAMLEFLKVLHRCELDEEKKVEWTSKRKISGWIVPVATGFHGITALSLSENQRDQDTPHRFAESVVTLGEFIMPYRIKNLDDMLWHTYADIENNLYLCQQNNITR